MEPIKNNDNEKIEEIKNIEKNGMRKLSDEELEGVAGGSAPGVLKREPEPNVNVEWD